MNIEKENKREMKALDDEQLDMVAGGSTGMRIETDYECRDCSATWKSYEDCRVCESCKSRNIIITAQRMIAYSTDNEVRF